MHPAKHATATIALYAMVAEDFRALTPLIHSHVNPRGSFKFGMAASVTGNRTLAMVAAMGQGMQAIHEMAQAAMACIATPIGLALTAIAGAATIASLA